MALRNRIEEATSYRGISQNEVERRCGFKPGVLAMLKKRPNPKHEKLEVIASMAARLHDRVPWTCEQRSDRPRINPIRIANALRIAVRSKQHVDDNLVRIVFDDVANQWVIVVGAIKDTSTFRYLVAHEIGEWYMKRTGYRHWNIEYLCDAFAYVLLMPAELLRPRLGGDSWAELPRLAESFDVPARAVAIRLALLFDVPAAVIDRGEVLRVNDWGVSTSDEWLRGAESGESVRVVEYGKLKVVVKL